MRLRQILLNLATNAVKFTAQGQVRITVESRIESQANRLCFSVQDTGIGIPREKLDEIFDAFTQSEISTSRKYGGSGLGLAIVRQLVCLMGGRMQVDSEPGQGSVFSFWMPLEPVPKPEIEATARETDEPNAVQRVARPARVLVVDDYTTNREIARFFLEEVGHQVVLAANGREAVQACGDQPFDVIVLDVQMPVMDGLETVNCLRRGSTTNARRPILALTASADADTHDLCLQAGFSEVITKPIRRAALLAAIADWQDRVHTGPADKRPGSATDVFGEPAESLPPLDVETAILEFGGAEAFGKILDQFVAAATSQVSNLREALDQQERTILKSIAHALKGGAATLEAVPLANAAADLETAAATADYAQLQQRVEDVAEQLQQLVQCINQSPHRLTEKEHAQSGH